MEAPKSCDGFSLFEVLISVFILTFGLLGIVAIYLNSLKRMENSYWQTLAISQLVAMTEQTRALDYDCSRLSENCQRLLPHGTCQCEKGKNKVCWGREQQKQCLELLVT